MASLSHSCYFRAWKSPSRQDKCKSLLPHVETLGAGPGRACLAASGVRVRARTHARALSLSLSPPTGQPADGVGSFPRLPRQEYLSKTLCLLSDNPNKYPFFVSL